MDLQEVSQIVRARGSEENLTLSRSELESRIVARMAKGMGWGGIVLFIGLALVILSKKYFHNDLFTMLSSLVTLSGVFIMSYAVFAAMMSGAKVSISSPSPKAGTRPDIADAAPPDLLSPVPPSVTERTTSLIEAEKTIGDER